VPLGSLALGSRLVEAQRPVRGHVITSETLPRARLAFDSTTAYAGTQTIRLSPVVMAEQHFFVDAEADGRVRRLYWVQFEGPGRYTYAGDPVAEISGIPFRENFRFYPANGLSDPPGSDGDQARRYLEQAGYRFGSDLARVRLVWLLGDVPAEHEVMIIYLEDLAGRGLTVQALRNDRLLWESLKTTLRTYAAAGIRISP